MTPGTHARMEALGLTATHYARVGEEYQPMDCIGSDGSRLIVYRPADDRYSFPGWCPWAAKPYGSHGGRYETFEAALAWLEWIDSQTGARAA